MSYRDEDLIPKEGIFPYPCTMCGCNVRKAEYKRNLNRIVDLIPQELYFESIFDVMCAGDWFDSRIEALCDPCCEQLILYAHMRGQ